MLVSKIHKQVGKLSMRLFLQLSEAQSTGLLQQQRPAEMDTRWRTGLPIINLRPHYNQGKHFVTYRHFCIPFWISWWILQSNCYNLLDRSIAFCRIKGIYNWKFSNNIKYRRYSPTFAWLTDITDMSVSHAKVGLYLQYFILFENFQL